MHYYSMDRCGEVDGSGKAQWPVLSLDWSMQRATSHVTDTASAAAAELSRSIETHASWHPMTRQTLPTSLHGEAMIDHGGRVLRWSQCSTLFLVYSKFLQSSSLSTPNFGLFL